MDEKIQKTKLENVEVSSSNVITSINGVDINELNKLEQEREDEKKKIKRHTEEEDMLNFNILFMLLGLGIGMVFGKFITSNIAIAMCSGTLIGLVSGIIYTEHLRKKNKDKRENGERRD